MTAEERELAREIETLTRKLAPQLLAQPGVGPLAAAQVLIKHLRLLANQSGGYTWVLPSDYRVAEVRLLHDVEEVGETRGQRSRAKDNLLIVGDALNALTNLCELPEFAREYVGKVKLAYLDPPFNTQQAFEHYDDALEHSVWLTMMRASDGRAYNPDFVAVERAGKHWLVETKATKDVENPDVNGKESAARRWARYVSDDPLVGTEWGYLLLSEDDIEAARGSWSALRELETGLSAPRRKYVHASRGCERVACRRPRSGQYSRYWPSLRPRPARISPANHDRIYGGKHLGRGPPDDEARLTAGFVW